MADSLNSLIDELSDGLTPVKPVRHPALRILPWLGFAFAYIVGASLFIGLRHDLVDKAGDLPFLFEMGLVFVMSITATLAASWLVIPDVRGQKWLLAVPGVLSLVFMLWIGMRAWTEGLHMPHDLYINKCVIDAVILGLVPVTGLVFLSKAGGATTHPFWLSFMSILSVGSMGWAALRFVCANDTIGHTFLYHFMPFIFLGTILGMLARRLYRW